MALIQPFTTAGTQINWHFLLSIRRYNTYHHLALLEQFWSDCFFGAVISQSQKTRVQLWVISQKWVSLSGKFHMNIWLMIFWNITIITPNVYFYSVYKPTEWPVSSSVLYLMKSLSTFLYLFTTINSTCEHQQNAEMLFGAWHSLKNSAI